MSWEEKMEQLQRARIPKPKKVQKPLRQKSLKVQAKEKAEAVKPDLDEWFDQIRQKHWVNGFCKCMECGEPILEAYSRPATAHLLAKKLFNSVKTHELNYLILGGGCGCHYKTDRVDKFVQMKCWPEALRRIKSMLPLIPPEEYKHLSEDLLTAIENG